jgi:P2-related tail formation protein
MSRFDLLPPNSTQFERDVSRTVSSLQRAGGPVPVIRTAKRVDIPDSVVPWLIYEYGLGEILPYLGNDQRRAVAEGVLWQRIRGTPESIAIALGWIGLQGTIDESEGGSYRWSEFQIGLPAATQGEAIINDIVGVARISAPVRSRLQRIYAVYDFRRFVLDDSLLSDGGMLSDHSGVRPRPDWPQISYGQALSALVDGSATVSQAHTACAGALVIADDVFRLDHSLLDEEWHLLNLPGLLTETIGLSAVYEGQTWEWFDWLDQSWPTPNVLVFSGMGTETSTPPAALVLHMDGANGSTLFVNDAQTNTLTAEVYGAARIVDDFVKWGTGSARFSWPPAEFGYTGHAIAFDHPLLAPGTGDFTIAAWIYVPGSLGIVETIIQLPSGSPGMAGRLFGQYVNATTFDLQWVNFAAGLTYSSPITFNAWHHVQLVRENGVIKMAVDGVPSATTVADTFNYNYNPGFSGRKTIIGNYTTGSTYGFGGRIDDLVYTVGHALPLVVPTGPYPNT